MNIAITGEGILCAIGADKASVLGALQRRESGITTMCHLRSQHHELPVGEVKMSDDEMKSLLGIDSSQEVSRTALMGMLAVRQALEDAHLSYSDGILRFVLISGTTVAGMDVTERHFAEMRTSDDHLSCLDYHSCGDNTRQIAEYFGCFTEYTTVSTACSSAANALILGAEMLKAGEADIVVAGGTEALSVFHLNGFNSLMILDKERCRPFDDRRAGLNLGEGAAYVVMESEEYACKRHASVHAYLSGYGNACDAFHQTSSSENGEGAYLAMQEALAMAQIRPEDIQYVNAHGTGTPNNDLSESVALKRVFGHQMPPVSSTKGFTGHTTSASGSIEAVICLLAMHYGFLLANLGWQQPMADGIIPTMGDDHVSLRYVLCNSFGFGGNDSSLVLSRCNHVPSYPRTSVPPITELARVEITSEDELGEIRDYVKPLEARRMGKLMKASLLSSLKALKQAGVDCPDAIITGTSLGCLENSEALLTQIEAEGEVMLSPTNFMQSTHNTIGSNIAIRVGCHGYNITYTQSSDSLKWAMRDARRLLGSGRCKTVLVGCHDEATPLYRSFMERMGKPVPPAIHSVSIVLTRKS
mgnify:CR=1 FL=1